MLSTSRYDVTADQEDAMRMEAGYPVKTFVPGAMVPLSSVKATRIRPGTAPASRRAGALGMTRADRTNRAFNKMVAHLDRTGRLYQPGLSVSGVGYGDTGRPSAPKMMLDPSPEAQSKRAAWSKVLRYRSEYQTCYGEQLTPPAGLDASVPVPQKPRPVSAMPATSHRPTKPPFHVPTRPNPANRHSQHCAVYNPAHHVSPNEAAGRFTGRVGAQTYTTMRGAGGGAGGAFLVDGDWAGAAPPRSRPASACAAAPMPPDPTDTHPAAVAADAVPNDALFADIITDADLAATAPITRTGTYAVAGAPGVKLIGGKHRLVPKAAAPMPVDASARIPGVQGDKAYTDFYGPMGGGGDQRVYYGRSYQPEPY